MSLFLKVIVALAVIVAVVVVVWLVIPPSPPPPPPSCIQLPEVEDASQRDAALKIAGEAEQLPIDGQLDAKFTQLSKKTYAQLSEKQVAFVLLLRAIECLVKSADTPEQKELVQSLAPELVTIARSLWASEYGLKGTGPELSPKERDLIRESSPPVANALFEELKKYDIE